MGETVLRRAYICIEYESSLCAHGEMVSILEMERKELGRTGAQNNIIMLIIEHASGRSARDHDHIVARTHRGQLPKNRSLHRYEVRTPKYNQRNTETVSPSRYSVRSIKFEYDCWPAITDALSATVNETSQPTYLASFDPHIALAT